MSFATSLVGLLVVSALTQATNYGGYRPPYYNYYYRRPYNYYHHYNYQYKPNNKFGPGPACGSDPYKLPNCQGKSTLNLDTCQCECPVPSEFCSKGYHFSQVFCECVPNGPPPPVPPPVLPPVPLPPPPPVRPQCRPCNSPYAVLDPSDCSCDCPASAQDRYCVYLQVIDPVTCTCFCPASAENRCGNHEVLDRTTCRCINSGPPNPPSCPVSAPRCNNLQVFDPVDCRCECREVIVVTTERTPGEAPGARQVVETTVTRPGTPRTPGGRRKTGTSRRSGSSRRRRGTGAHLIEKRRKKKTRSPGTRTTTTTLTTIPGAPGRPGNLVETRRRIPAPCPSGYIEDSACECLRL